MIPENNIPTKAYVVDSPGAPFTLQDVILDEVKPDEVLVEIQYTGLCHTDIVVQKGIISAGQYPAVLGHEGVGIVRRVGSSVKDKTLKDGDLVFLGFNTCNNCSACHDERKGFCHSFTSSNFVGGRGENGPSPISSTSGKSIRGKFFGQSSMSKLAIVAESSIVKSPIPLDIDTDLAPLAPLGCGYITGAGTVMNVLKPKPSTKLVVLGMGAVGLAAVMAARAMGVETIIGADFVDAKLELAKEVGASHILNTKKVAGLKEGLLEMFPGGVDQILDTTGVVPLLEASIEALGHEGVLVIVGVVPAGAKLSFEPQEFMMACKQIIGSIEGCSNPQVLLPQLIKLYKEGKFPVDKLFKVYDTRALEDALEDLKLGKVIKPILKWTDL
ncbi:Polyketide synthase enoylreductase [Penicillium taxi]|uniref:Polyketide synthase enoylreductase n=1 Tax=Penicillium taxi TaxID=168475 RepID=UPI002545809B|nr:Polyketide synthase enoylreductase [Penicillium taxi]KAJ5898913.1 Polyketide synthase enoylreductase [Penicillium taxi]